MTTALRDPLPIKSSGNQPPLALVETAFLSSTACLLFLILNYLQIGKTFLKSLLALPLALVYLRWGKRAGWMSVVVTSLLLLVLAGPVNSILFTIPHGLLGIQLGAFWRRRISWGWSIFVGGILDTLGFFLRLHLSSILIDEDLWSYTINRASDILSWVLEKSGILAEPSYWGIQLVIIGLVFINGLQSSLVTHYAALLLFKRIGEPISSPPAWIKKSLEI
jgi:uncharacterized protein YybS (DUF2232 family)